MKKTLLLLALTLALALPLLGLAAQTVLEPENTAPRYGQTGMGRGWGARQAPLTGEAPLGFVDENKDGLCDGCGKAQGTNTEASGFLDQNRDGVCDNLGTDRQYQAYSRRGRNRR